MVAKKDKNLKVKISTYSLYPRQYDGITRMVEEGLFRSKSEVIREALDFFFCFPYFKQIANKHLNYDQAELEKEYNARVIKVLDGV